LRVVDKNFEKDEQYLYAIIPYDRSRMDTGFVFVDTRLTTEIPKAPELEKNEMENQIELRWSIQSIQNAFTAYWIERSEDGRNWKRLNNIPYLQATQNPNQEPDEYIYYTDTTIARNYLPYKYRLIGITPFAELSEPSDVIEAMGRDRSGPQPPIITSIKDVNGKIELEWQLENPPSDLKGFMIGRSSSIGGQYEPITPQMLGTSARKYTDSNPDPIDENYYVVFAIDTAGNASVSMPAYGFLIDSIPPAKPIGLTGNIDTLGVVTLRWPLGQDPDITGYRVYFANAADHEFSNLTPYPIQDTVFVDTISLNTLTKEIFYQIAAVDRNFNHSVRSDILRLVKPDIVPPVTPLISDYLVTDTAVILKIIPSSSDDVAEHILFRKGEKQTGWTPILTLNNSSLNQTEIFDNNVTGPNYYLYALQSVDSSGNKSELSPSVGVRVRQNLKVFQIEGLNASYDNQKKVVSLTWKKPQGDLKYYVIYRKVNAGKFENFASVDPDKSSFSDSELIYQGEYQYGIKGVFSSNESQISISSPVLVK
ncbi:fibronectin type III domain-containing protein, partial [Ignavibacterium sp.]|uniref:fibronectin type III domain-containing protein n=2 Tax=Ignavibacterium TaxID=795750 RepID=UPI0025BF1DFB